MVIEGRKAMEEHQKTDGPLKQLSCPTEQGTEKTARKIFDANNFEMDGNKKGVFLQASRFNHSCAPNAHFQWNSKLDRLTVHAIENIPAHAEILINYRVKYSFNTTSERRKELLKGYKFRCNCNVCQPNTGDTAASDKRRKEMRKLEKEITKGKRDEKEDTPRSDRMKIRNNINALKHLLQQEGLFIPYMADWHLEELQWYARERERWNSKSSGIESVGSETNILGLALQTARNMLDLDIAAAGHESDQVDKALKWIRDVKTGL